jgi:DDE family transposase
VRSERMVLDIDATPIDVHTEREGAAVNFKGGFGFHPMLAYLDGSREALAGTLRPGNAPAHSAAGDALLASLIFWRLRASAGRIVVRIRFLARVAVAAAAASVALVLPVPDLLAAALAGVLFLGVGQLIGMVPAELRDALGPRGMFGRQRGA